MTKFEKLQESEGKLGLSHQGIAPSFFKDVLISILFKLIRDILEWESQGG